MKNSGSSLKIIISGGGSGGHVFPAIAIANALKKKKPDAEILFVGAKGKLEMEKVPKAGYQIIGLWITGIQRKLTARNLLFPLKLLNSMWNAWRIIRNFKPNVVVGVGGFASGPMLEVASRMRVPTLIQEQNSYAGLTNKLLAKKVDKICIAYEGMERFFPKEKLVMTGNPVRGDLAVPRSRVEAAAHFGLDPKSKILFVFGGSLGAKSINEAMAANTELLAQNPGIQVLWQMGKLYVERFENCATAKLPNVHAIPFVDRMDLAYAMADLVICRAGAMTISELCLVGQPAILIPSPNVAEDHQTPNAQALMKQNAGVWLPDSEASEKIIQRAKEVIEDEALLKQLSENISRLAVPDASDRIADEVLKLT